MSTNISTNTEYMYMFRTGVGWEGIIDHIIGHIIDRLIGHIDHKITILPTIVPLGTIAHRQKAVGIVKGNNFSYPIWLRL